MEGSGLLFIPLLLLPKEKELKTLYIKNIKKGDYRIIWKEI